MKKIKLTRGKFALVDDEDFQELSKYKWQAKTDGYNWYAKRGYYNKETKKCVEIKMHRQIMNHPIGMKIDHINHNGLDCQKQNLRICTHGENMMNRKKKVSGISKYLGVSISKSTVRGKIYKYWSAVLRADGKVYNIGKFKTEENAAIAYNIFAEKHHGQFANYNKPIWQ